MAPPTRSESDLPVLSQLVIPAHCQPERASLCTHREDPRLHPVRIALLAHSSDGRLQAGTMTRETFGTSGKSQELMPAWFPLVGKDGRLVSNTRTVVHRSTATAFSRPQPPLILATGRHQQFLVYPSRNIYDREFLDHTVSRALFHGFPAPPPPP